MPIRPIRGILTRAHERSENRATQRAETPIETDEVGPWKINVPRWGPIQESTWTPSPTKVIHLTVIGASRVFIFFRYPVARVRARRRRLATFCAEEVARRCKRETTDYGQIEISRVRCFEHGSEVITQRTFSPRMRYQTKNIRDGRSTDYFVEECASIYCVSVFIYFELERARDNGPESQCFMSRQVLLLK